MDDLIRRQDAIDAINKALDRETLLNSFVRKIAVDAVNVLPSAQQWIPVKERYPDKQGVYLVTVMNCTTMATYIIDGFGRSYFNILGVTAWQLPPDHYKEESNGTH